MTSGAGSPDRIGLFFKTPVPGRVKTRLSPPLPPVDAARLYEAFLLDSIRVCRRIETAHTVLFDSADSDEKWSNLPADLPCLPQSGGDLGERMTAAFRELLGSGARKAVLVGSDSPTLPGEYLEAAFRQLDRSDLVLGPATDGGYYLIGLTRDPGDLFTGMSWSVATVLETTEERARRMGWDVSRTSLWYDVDNFDDLQRLRRDIGSGADAPSTRAVLATLGLAPA